MHCASASKSAFTLPFRGAAASAARRGCAPASTIRSAARTFASSSSSSSSSSSGQGAPRSRLVAALAAAAAATTAAAVGASSLTGSSPLPLDSLNSMLLSASSVDCKSAATPSYDAPTPIDMHPTAAMDFRHRGPGSFKDPKVLDTSLPMSERMAAYTRELQSEIVGALESLEQAAGNPNPAPFFRDSWTRADGHGGGQSCVLANGRVFEKAGVMVTKMEGQLSPAGVKQMRAQGRQWDLPEGTERVPFFAAGISIVIHPHNPHAPTAHMNYRYFEIRHPNTGEPVAWWFGGGADLTPMVVDDTDAKHFHAQLQAACDRHLDTKHGGYPGLKKWCDEYFTLQHRGETRGVGGIFFDDFDFGSPYTKGMSKDAIFAFVRDAGRTFVPAYAPLVAKGYAKPYTHAEKEWQQLRRGRYVEFNLVYDRGTKFGLLTPGARIESILVSLPLTARWEYCHAPVPGSPEARTLDILRKPRDWMGVGVGLPLEEQEGLVVKGPVHEVKKVPIKNAGAKTSA